MNVANNPLRSWDEGRLETGKWQDEESKDPYATNIIANAMKLLRQQLRAG